MTPVVETCYGKLKPCRCGHEDCDDDYVICSKCKAQWGLNDDGGNENCWKCGRLIDREHPKHLE
jgi:predicted amidophosphoribosyltransferase